MGVRPASVAMVVGSILVPDAAYIVFGFKPTAGQANDGAKFDAGWGVSGADSSEAFVREHDEAEGLHKSGAGGGVVEDGAGFGAASLERDRRASDEGDICSELRSCGTVEVCCSIRHHASLH